MHEPDGAFQGGDYLFAARHLSRDSWQYWASLGLIGHPGDSAAELTRFTDPQATFFSGVASWIAGDNERARRVLEQCAGAHAKRLVELMAKRPITVLAQLPWNRRGAWDILSHLRDPAFRLLNISYHPDDIQNRPHADAATLIPAGVKPDFFAAEMLEWHLIPPNIRALGCPVLGHSSDFDLHIQTVAPWLELFDEIIVLDDAEWRAMTRLVDVPVSVFPKVFGVPAQLPELSEAERDIDVFVSGTVSHPYHPDKDPVVLDVLGMPGVRLKIVEGFEGTESYYQNLGRSKATFTYIRHPGAMPTRALEALGMGCAVAVQEESSLRLFGGESEGIVSYTSDTEGPARAIERVLVRWDEYRSRARTGAAMVRREFALERVASQYFRFLTVLAARPRESRIGPSPDRLVQKRPVVQRGWLPSNKFGKRVLMDWASSSATRITHRLQSEESIQLLNDLAREHLLAHYHDPYSEDASWLQDVVALLKRAIGLSPSFLVPRFNLVRVLLHFGGPRQVTEGVALLDDTLDEPVEIWRVDVLDDVLPWDFCPSGFNYRRYLDLVTRALGARGEREPELIVVILASLNHYRARYADEIVASRNKEELAAEAVRLDPEFADYALYYCRLLISRGTPGDLSEVSARLQWLAARSARVLEILDIARHLPADLQGKWFQGLETRVARFWSSTKVREELSEPVLRSARFSHAPLESAVGEVL